MICTVLANTTPHKTNNAHMSPTYVCVLTVNISVAVADHNTGLSRTAAGSADGDTPDRHCRTHLGDQLTLTTLSLVFPRTASDERVLQEMIIDRERHTKPELCTRRPRMREIPPRDWTVGRRLSRDWPLQRVVKTYLAPILETSSSPPLSAG